MIFAPKEHTALQDPIPPRFSLYTEEESGCARGLAEKLDPEKRWWESFQSPELNALIEEALTNSPTIQQAWARLAQAKAIAAKAGASRYPSLKYEGLGSGTRRSTLNNGQSTIEEYALGLAATYEVDLWGRIRSQAEAAALDRKASREDLNTAAITLAAQVAANWAEIISQRLQAELLRRQLQVNKTTEQLIELRFRKSLSTALDVYQQRQTVAATESVIPLLEMREMLLINQLAALLGRSNSQTLKISEKQLPKVGNDFPAIGIPADVLANRPDVRRAGLRLMSADWSVSAARADRLPAIRLTASASYGGNNIEASEIFDDWMANLAASLTGPIFEGYRRKAEVERTRAVAAERLAAYRETVIRAIKEVEDALAQEQKQREYLAALEKRIEAAQRSYTESENRYRNGLTEYTTVLIHLNSLQQLKRTYVEAQFHLLNYRIALFRALGGTWPNTLKAPNFESEE